MPITRPKQTAASDSPMAVASFNPDNMIQGGLMDDFNGTIVKSRLVPWDYNGNIDHHILAVALTIQPDEGEGDEFTQHYSAGELENFVPSMDGRTPVDLDKGEGEELEGVYALRVGKKEGLNNNSNWAHFITALLDANFDKSAISAEVTFVEGLHGHFNRVPQKKRSGIVVRGKADDKPNRNNDILVITEITDAPKGAKGKAAAKPAAAAAKAAPVSKPNGAAGKPAPASNGAGLDDRLRELVTEAVLAAEEGLPKSKLASIAISNFAGADKGKAVKRIQEADFLNESDTWTYDADSATLFSNA